MTPRLTTLLRLALALLIVGSASALAAEPASPMNALLEAAERQRGGKAPPAAPASPVAALPASRGTTYYVSPSGSDSVTCAQAQRAQTPRRTINAGIACLAGGETLVLKPGHYDELITDMPGINGYTVPVPGGSPGAYTTIRAETPGTVLVTARDPIPGGGSLVELDQNSYIAIDGLTLDGQFTHQWIIGFGKNHHLRFSNSEVKHGTHGGIIGTSGHAMEFLNLHVHHNALDYDGRDLCVSIGGRYSTGPDASIPGRCHGLYISGEGHLVDGGHWHHNEGHGIHYYPRPVNGIIRNALVTDNSIGIGVYGPRHQIYNNVLVRNKIGILVKTGSQTIVHNTVYAHRPGTDNYGILSFGANVIKNNLVLEQSGAHAGRAIVVDDGQGNNGLTSGVDPSLVAGNLCDAPHMVGCGLVPPSASVLANPQGGDFHLCAGSPAIAAGRPVPEAAMRSDKDGVARPSTGAADVGAYQYVAGGSTRPPARTGRR